MTRYSDILWKDIAEMRDKLIHDHFGVDIEKNEIVGVTILNFEKSEIEYLPLYAKVSLVQN